MMNDFGVTTAEEYLQFANNYLHWTPTESVSGRQIYSVLSTFYFILDQPPLRDLQVPIEPYSIGRPLPWLSSWIVVYAQLMGQWMDTPPSLTNESLATFYASPRYRLDEALVPPGGWKNFNEFFGRKLVDGARPVAPGKLIVTYPCDCSYDSAFDIDSNSTIDVKGVQWNIDDLLHPSAYEDSFQGGVFMHAFLNTHNYHRQHAPVGGRVLEARVIQGAAYLEVQPDGTTLRALRRIPGPDAQDGTGYQFLQTRGLIVIETDDIGLVAILPIGMAQVSSVVLSVKPGDRIEKGDEISYFQFGGSDCVVVFQKEAGLKDFDFHPSPDDPGYSLYGSLLAEAKPSLE
ncbi:phosphatidylserine decarboxylase-like protein [Xylariaceae sp. FL1019]|nr:phosphatidylserine decarboxylase-like protein [Xylariaceae sp. FL1019]